MTRLTAAQIKPVKIRLLAEQGGVCAICKQPCAPVTAVLDHDHRTGAVRAALHRGCNSLLGKLENNAARYGVKDIGTFTNGVAAYLRMHMTNITGYLHPTHKTEEEKRVRRNTKARVRRATKRDTA